MQADFWQFKTDHASDETVTDDVAGKAYVEQFGTETFTRADNAMRADRSSKQTAETFQASATFLELLAIWGPLEPDIQQRVKFAKFHALRIVKALKAGEDPNASNPKPEPATEELPPGLDPNDPEVQALNGDQSKNRQPSVVEAPDEADNTQARLARQSLLNESLHPSRAPSQPPPNASIIPQGASADVSPMPKDAADFYSNNQNDVSPMSPDRKSSMGGNYFPSMPSPTSAQTQPDLPTTLPCAPVDLDDSEPGLDLPSAPPGEATGPILPIAPSEPGLPSAPTTFAQSQPQQPRTPLDSFRPPPAPGQPSIASIPSSHSYAPPQLPPQQHQTNAFVPPAPTPTSITSPPRYTAPPSAAPSQPAYVPASHSVTNANVEVDEEAMMKAQKHARWAISALNFEDVPTAIKEFQLALQTLGARQ